MGLRFPAAPDVTTQVEFTEINRRLRALERRTGLQGAHTTLQIIGGSGGTVDLKPITDRLTALEIRIGGLGNPAAVIPDFGSVGPEATRGLVPSPETSLPPTGVAQHVLTEGNDWGFPLRGLIGVATPGDETVASDTINALGNVIATGKVVATTLEAGEIRAHGILYGEPEQARLRGLVQVSTDLGQSDLVDDKLSILADVHMQDLSATRIECQDIAVYGTASINATIDGGVP